VDVLVEAAASRLVNSWEAGEGDLYLNSEDLKINLGRQTYNKKTDVECRKYLSDGNNKL
jgi:hypothetical protein